MEYKSIVMSARTIKGLPSLAFITKKKNNIVEVCAFLLILLFVYAASSKLFRWHLFRFQLESYPWIQHFAGWIVWIVPALELGITAALLIPGRIRRIGFYASLVLLFIFTVYLLIMLGTQHHLPCSCGGVIQGMTWGQHVVFNLFFIVLSLMGGLCEKEPLNNVFSSSL
jgi:uncharacterized membrane protein YphA (DoxX/SURF4 family)